MRVATVGLRMAVLVVGLTATTLAESINAIRARAIELYNEGRYQEALPLFGEVIACKPRDLEARAKRGSIYLRLDQPDRALDDFNRAIQWNGGTFIPDQGSPNSLHYPAIHTNRGTALLMLGRPREAIDAFQAAANIYQADPGWHQKIPINYQINQASPYTGLGDAYHALGQEQDALAAYNTALGYDPDCPPAYHGRGTVLAALGRLDKAVADLDNAIRLYAAAPRVEPALGRAYRARGEAYARLGRTERALADLGKAIRIDPKFTGAYKDRGGIYVRVGQFEKATKDLDEAIKLDPRRVGAFVNRAAAHNSLGHYEKAVADCDTALEIDPENAAAFNNRALAHYALGHFDRSLSDLNAALERAPDDARLYLTRGNTHARVGRMEFAARDYDEAIRLEPGLLGAYAGLGIAHEALGRRAEAIRDYDMALRIDPRNAGLYCNRGGVKRSLDDWKGAIADFTQALIVDPKHADAYVSRGWARLVIGRDGADADARAYLDLKGGPDPYAPIMGFLGALGARQAGREVEARAFLGRVAEAVDPNRWPYPILSYLRRDISVRILLESAADLGKLTEARLFIGLDRLVAGQQAEALEHLRWVRDRGLDGSAARDIARALLLRLEGPPPEAMGAAIPGLALPPG